MKNVSSVLLGLSLAVVGSSFAAAQEMQGPPKVLQITREFIKPGKAGALHDKSESRFVAAMAAAKWPTHYFALNSLSGKSRALYFVGYPSFAAWEKDNEATMKNPALSAELEKASVADGELLDGLEQFVFTYDEDLSYRPSATLAHARYFEVASIHVKPGHIKEFRELSKLYIDTAKKAGTSGHWATYEVAYGADNLFLILSDDKSMADIDTGYAEEKQFLDALGEDGLKRMRELERESVQDSDSQLFEINPKQSYPPDAWVKDDPDFWKPKPEAPAAKPATAAKKAAQ
ncbi:MAG: hypothetical protein ABSF23_13530 [Terracidiphilus sp.]|jgi:hypothetical protein